MLHFAHDFDCCIAVIERVVHSAHQARCVAVIGETVGAEVGRIVAAGCWGLAFESSPPSTYCEVITDVAAGRLAYSAAILDRIVTTGGRMTLMPKATESVEQLTAQERALVRLLADGLTTTEAANALGMTPASADRLRRNLMTRLNLRNRAMLVRFAIRVGLVEL